MLDFDLPEKLIAQEPAHPRDHARLLVYSLDKGEIIDDYFYNLQKYLNPKTTLVINDSKVEKCRWIFGKLEVFVLNKHNDRTVTALVRPGRKFKEGSSVELTGGVFADVLSVNNDGHRTLRLSVPVDDPRLLAFEHIPLPPYIGQNDDLADEYQTVFADPLGSKAAPTAGLHFTDQLLDKISLKHEVAKVTLHVGLGTFMAPTEEQLKSKSLHSEHYSIDVKNVDIINRAEHITSVGTTSTRTLESFAKTGKLLDDTDIFIQPGDSFVKVDSLITNFHLPKTSLLMLVAAFIGNKRNLSAGDSEWELLKVYQHAIDKGYRFYSFGDAMLLV